MALVTRKREIAVLDGTPEKRMFWSIISDYDTTTALCELVDNALDTWAVSGRSKQLIVALLLDTERQLVRVSDNAGGVALSNLRLLISPGGSRNDPDAETIGIFGVGSKRAAVALAESVTIKTRAKSGKTAELEITKDWLASSDWDLPAYEVADIGIGRTEISLSALRRPIKSDDVSPLQTHLAETYGRFLAGGDFELLVNEIAVSPIGFDSWAYPRGYEPRQADFNVDIAQEGVVRASITAGLILDRDASKENYGVYFYCNGRLVAKHLKVREVGYFIGSEAGVPHPDASLCRVIVVLEGPAKLMPWNSSKTGINYAHPVFQALTPTLIPLVSHFSSLSRRLKHTWEKDVFSHRQGTVQKVDSSEPSHGKRVLLPDLPRVNKTHIEHLISKNRKPLRDAPWTLGLIEAVAAVDMITRQRLQTKNRIALILLDSNFEIALKEFMVHRTNLFPSSKYTDSVLKNLFKNRADVINEVSAKVAIPADLLDRAKHYYGMRNKFIHERATVDVVDADIQNYRATIQKILKILFGVTV
jgi:hypothetical protein